MTPIQWAALVGAAVCSFLAGDLLRSRDWPGWPHTLSILVLAAVGGWFRSPEVLAAMLGAGVGWLAIGGLHAVGGRRNRADRGVRVPSEVERRAHLRRRT